MATWEMLIVEAAEKLKEAQVHSPLVDARELAEYVSSVKRPSGDVTLKQAELFFALVERRQRREPLQHLTGRMYFRYLELLSRPGTFIVRPETELVAEEAIREASTQSEAVVLDLCTGSGAIAIAVATEVSGSVVVGVEKSRQAYETAKENNHRYGDAVHMVHADALSFEGLEGVATPGHIDVVVSNPPYVPPHHRISAEAQADPGLALWGGGEDGLDLPRALVQRASYLLRPGGLLVMEHSEEQGEALRDFARAHGFTDCSTGRDYTGRQRWLRARRALSLQGGLPLA